MAWFYPSAETEERVIWWLMVGIVLFFLFAAITLPPDESGEGRKKDAYRPNNYEYMTTRRLLFNEIYSRTFVKLKDEKEQFLTPETAKLFLPGYPESKRRAHCDGMVSDIPSLVLRVMGLRCPPLELL